MSAMGCMSIEKSIRGIRPALLTSLAQQHKVCLDHQGTPEIAGHKRVTNTQKKQRKKDEGEERKISSSPYVAPMQYERDIDKSAHLQFYCIQEPKININVPPLGVA